MQSCDMDHPTVRILCNVPDSVADGLTDSLTFILDSVARRQDTKWHAVSSFELGEQWSGELGQMEGQQSLTPRRP